MRFLSRTSVPIIGFSGLAVLLSVMTSYRGSTAPIFLLNEVKVLYLFSTSAQVLAGVYGLTLTGFIFFRNELSREEFEDETLTEAVESLKARYFALLTFITALVLGTFAVSNVAMSGELVDDLIESTLIINTAQSLFATSLVAIAYFIFDVTWPRRIARASRALQDQVDPTHSKQTKGSLEEFLRSYNEIERLLIDYGLVYRQSITYEYSKPSRRIANSRLAEILARNERISKQLYLRIKDLITLRNSIIHGADPVVSQEFVAESASVADELRRALQSES